MKRLLVLLVLLCAACAPVYLPAPDVTPIVRNISPQEAAEIVIDATNTAAAVATQAAYSTATEESARATSTSARQATLDALAGQQTESALQLTQGAGLAAATDAAAVRTQASGQTQAWATPTWSALSTQSALARAGLAATATAISVQSAAATTNTDGLRGLWYVALALAVVFGIVIGSVVTYWTHRRLEAAQAARDAAAAEAGERDRLDTDRSKLELERAGLQLIRDLMIERDGQPWTISPGGVLRPMLPGGVAPVSQPNRAHEWRWRAACKKAVLAGIAEAAERGSAQFGERDLAGREPGKDWIVNADRTPSSTGYRQINRILREVGVWITAGGKTVFAPGWTAENFEHRFDQLPLPNLPAGEPPEVRTALRSSAPSAVSASPAAPQAEP